MTVTGLGSDATTPGTHRRLGRRRALVALELFTGSTAVLGGVLLVVKPDGSWLQADPAVLVGSPFQSWRLPGILLTTLVGGGFLTAAGWQWRGWWRARELSVLAGAGLICFEAAEVGWIGFQPLQAVFALVGVAVIVLALSLSGGGRDLEHRQAEQR